MGYYNNAYRQFSSTTHSSIEDISEIINKNGEVDFLRLGPSDKNMLFLIFSGIEIINQILSRLLICFSLEQDDRYIEMSKRFQSQREHCRKTLSKDRFSKLIKDSER